MKIDWAVAGTMLFGALLALLGSTIASLIKELVGDHKTKTHMKRRLQTQMSGLVESLRRLVNLGHKETDFFEIFMTDMRHWLDQLLQDRAQFSHFKDPAFERAIIDWHLAITRLTVISAGIDASGEEWIKEGKDPTERIIAWREGLFTNLKKEADKGDALLKQLDGQ